MRAFLVFLSVGLFNIASVTRLGAQDTRTVREPRLPQVCASLTARLASANGQPPAAEGTLDTARIQHAIDHCVAGRAVELRAEGPHDAFVSGPLELRPSVTVVIAADAVLFGSRNPREYDVRPGTCGVVNDDGHGCKPLIHAASAPHAGVMGLGTIDGQGGARLIGQETSWWDLAHQAKIADKKQNCSRLIVADASDDFTLYGITLRNSPNFHVLVNGSNGFTAWGVRIDSPATARNTDGIDPASSTNVTIAYSYIRAGDDNIAIKAGKAGPATHMTIEHNHFYSGHGMSIGSETNGGVSAIRVADLTIEGADNGLRIKSDRSRGGLVRNVTYHNICIRETKNPIVIDPFYSQNSGGMTPEFQDIILRNVHAVTPGKVTLMGSDAEHLLRLHLDNVRVEGIRSDEVKTQHARIEIGPGGVNIPLQGVNVQAQGKDKGGEPLSCRSAFPGFPDGPVVDPQTQSGNDLYPDPGPPAAGNRHMVTVAADGSAEYRTVQAGIDALAAGGGTVHIKPGIYREVVRVAKPNVRMEGAGDSPEQTRIVFGNSAGSSGSTFKSATVFVNGDDFLAKNITFENDYSRGRALQPQGSQAIALSVTGDRAIFRGVRILGAQDTLYAASRSCRSESGPCIPTRQFFEDCYIAGNVDFIFGDSQAVFKSCRIHAIAHPTVMVTAQSKHYPEEASGFVFDRCRITADSSVDRVFLGRPWRNYATVVFLESELDEKVDPAGWSEWHAEETRRLESAFYAEYKSTGPGANAAHREPYSRQLSATEAARYRAREFLAGADGWNPEEAK